jgi:predicted alpha/beta superfamily hydrolase
MLPSLMQLSLGLLGILATAHLEPDRATVQLNDRIFVQSKALGETREAWVRVPPGYESSTSRFPVVYLLDGDPSRIGLLTGVIENLVGSYLIPELIVVSIPNTVRPRDMTPTQLASTPLSGGGDKFLSFIKTELAPQIEKSYRVQPYRILVGHSMSGLLVAHAFVSDPGFFGAYLAASPFLSWDENFVTRTAERNLKGKALKKTTYFVLGDEPAFSESFDGFQQVIQNLNAEGLESKFVKLPTENHWSTNIDVFNNGLRFAWRHWRPWEGAIPSDANLASLEQSFSRASHYYGFEIPIPERSLLELASLYLGRQQFADAIKVAERGAEMYPESASSQNLLGGVMERAGDLGKAKTAYEKALILARKMGHARMVDTITASIKRVSKSPE